jgi:hypothetical protein
MPSIKRNRTLSSKTKKGGTCLNNNDKLIEELFNLIESQLKGTDGKHPELDQLKALIKEQGSKVSQEGQKLKSTDDLKGLIEKILPQMTGNGSNASGASPQSSPLNLDLIRPLASLLFKDNSSNQNTIQSLLGLLVPLIKNSGTSSQVTPVFTNLFQQLNTSGLQELDSQPVKTIQRVTNVKHHKGKKRKKH